MSEKSARLVPMSEVDRAARAVSALRAVADLIGSAENLHVVNRENLSELLYLILEEMEPFVA